MDHGQAILEFAKRHPDIPIITPSSCEYDKLRKAYILDNPAVPSAIVRPQTADDVADIVKYAVSASLEFTVRSGGNDVFGRCFVDDALAIDMRDISFVNISSDKRFATVGGGTSAGDVATRLAKEGLATAFGSVPWVGYVGWATHGGYGQFTPNFGLGADQIVGARVVNCDGQTVQAEEDMLIAIRGGGGAVGVIVDITAKVYQLEKVLAGIIAFKSSNITTTIARFSTGYRQLIEEGLPLALGIQQTVANTPVGRCFVVGFMWSSQDLEEGRQYLETIKTFGQVVHSNAQETTIPEWMKTSAEVVPASAFGRNCTINAREITDEVVNVMGKWSELMPDDSATLFSIHQLRGQSTIEKSESIWQPRTPHYCVEFIATGSDKQRVEAAWQWARNFRDALSQTNPKNLLASTYIVLTPPEEARMEHIYGDKWQTLLRIKEKYDPNNAFKHALPKFCSSDCR